MRLSVILIVCALGCIANADTFGTDRTIHIMNPNSSYSFVPCSQTEHFGTPGIAISYNEGGKEIQLPISSGAFWGGSQATDAENIRKIIAEAKADSVMVAFLQDWNGSDYVYDATVTDLKFKK